MKFVLLFFAGVGIGTIAGFIGTLFPTWNDFVWWMGGAIITAIAMKQL